LRDSNNAFVNQEASNNEINNDTNSAGGAAPTTQTMFGDNQKTAQTQTIAKSGGGSDTQYTAVNTMQNLNDSPHKSTTTLFGSQTLQHVQTISNSPNSKNTVQEGIGQLNTNHHDDTSNSNSINQLLYGLTQSHKFTQNVINSPGSQNAFTRDDTIQNLH
jgi:hypothetical protein